MQHNNLQLYLNVQHVVHRFHNDKIFSFFKKVSMDNIITNSFSKLRFDMTYKNFSNQIGDLKIDNQLNNNFEREMHNLKLS